MKASTKIKNLTEVAEVEIRYKTSGMISKSKYTCSSDSEKLFRQYYDRLENIEHVESFLIMLLNRTNRMLAIGLVSSGGVSGTVVDPKIVFQYALKANASGIIVAHNHPSGNLFPSESDKTITKKLTEGGKYLDIAVLDHLILTRDNYFSFADEGLM
jgi:DNA repair protein RadC